MKLTPGGPRRWPQAPGLLLTLGFDTKMILLHQEIDIFRYFSILRYFSVAFFHLLLSIQIFPHQNNPIFCTKHPQVFLLFVSVAHSSLWIFPLLKQHLTNSYLPTADLRVTSITAIKSVIDWSHLHQPYKWFCAESRRQKGWHPTARWDTGFLQQQQMFPTHFPAGFTSLLCFS